jgi:hypothetical protein
MRWHEIQTLSENASSGATGGGAVATLIGNKSYKGTIGAGFNPDGDYGVYSKKKIRQNKLPSIIKRRHIV